VIRAIEGPRIVQPDEWTLVFDRKAATRLKSWAALGTYKHVRAYAYVPFLHVWVFYDPHWCGTEIVVAADGEPAQQLLRSWIAVSDPHLIRMRRTNVERLTPPLAGWCVPAIKRLLGIRCGALRCDALFAHCLAHGGERVRDGQGQE
jgi:hypothetical protein